MSELCLNILCGCVAFKKREGVRHCGEWTKPCSWAVLRLCAFTSVEEVKFHCRLMANKESC